MCVCQCVLVRCVGVCVGQSDVSVTYVGQCVSVRCVGQVCWSGLLVASDERGSCLKTQVGVVGHGGHPEDTGISPGQGAVSWGHRVPGHAGVSSGYGVPRIPRCPGTPYPEDTGGILGKPRYPEQRIPVVSWGYRILRIPMAS